MVNCGCTPVNTLDIPKPIIELCPTIIEPVPIIKIETAVETINKNCFNGLAINFSYKKSCGGMNCGE